jgi:hypothetical protein
MTAPTLAAPALVPTLNNPSTFSANADDFFGDWMPNDLVPWAAAFAAHFNAYSTGEGNITAWTATVTDDSSNVSATTQAGWLFELGRFCAVGVASWNNISTAGMVSGNGLRIPLPYTVRAGLPGVGGINIQNLATVPVAGTILPVAIQGGNFARLICVGATATSQNLRVQDISTGVSDVNHLFIPFVRAD